MTPEEENKYAMLKTSLTKALLSYTPDEFDIGQRKLLYALAEFILEPYYLKLKKEEDDTDQ